MKQRILGVFMLALGLNSSNLRAESVFVAVASNFLLPMEQLAQQFQQETGHKVKLSFGSSGKLFAQIYNGAPFHVFFSADQAKPIALEKKGLVVDGSRFTYALGGLALWSNKVDYIDSEGQVLEKGNFKKLALANPKLAPYGVASTEVLQNLGLTAATRSKLVKGENISQTYQFIASGNADLGFVALSQIDSKASKGSVWIVPHELFNPIRQDAVLLTKGQNNGAAFAFMTFMKGPKAKAIIEASGYQVP